jgi:hypothetical protein
MKKGSSSQRSPKRVGKASRSMTIGMDLGNKNRLPALRGDQRLDSM